MSIKSNIKSLEKGGSIEPQPVLRPLFSQRIACGLFGISDDYIEKYQSLDSKFVKNPYSTFFFQAISDSMQPTIFEDDVLVVDRSIEPVSGKIAVVSVHSEMICKRLLKRNGYLYLSSDNKRYKDVKVTEEMNLTVFGTVVAIARHT